jgi:polyisoprenoid-binding protein YceI
MKHILSKLFAITILSVFFVSSSQAAPETYKLDPMHTYVLWHISHFGFSHPSGKWFANGTLILDKAKPENSKVNVVINIADIDTGIPKLDEHLKGKDFFDVAAYPTPTYVSNKVDPTGKSTAIVYGVLTLHGVSKPVTLHVTLNKAGEFPMNHKYTVGFSATTEIHRSNFGMTNYLPDLGDNVKIYIEAEAQKA